MGSSGNSLFGKVSNLATQYGLSTAAMWGVVIGSILLFGLLLVGVHKYMFGKKKKAMLALDDDEDAVTRSRREPLVNNPEVYIA
jgi:cbb3-type cytochrome oxidase subunit 3